MSDPPPDDAILAGQAPPLPAPDAGGPLLASEPDLRLPLRAHVMRGAAALAVLTPLLVFLFHLVAYRLNGHPLVYQPIQEQVLALLPAVVLAVPAGVILGAVVGWLYGQLGSQIIGNPFRRTLVAHVIEASSFLALLLAIPVFLVAFGILRTERNASSDLPAVAGDAGRALLYAAIGAAVGAGLGLGVGTLIWGWRRLMGAVRSAATAEQYAADIAAVEDHGGPVRCDRCGTESLIKEFFVETHRSFQAGLFYYCPPCWEKLQLAWRRNTFLAWAGLLALGAVLSLASLGDFLLKAAVLLAVVTLLAIPRELGQAVVARLLGLRVYELSFGQGHPWLSMTLAGIPLRFKGYPLDGSTTVGQASRRGARRQRILVILTGLAVDAAFPLLLIWWLWPMNDYVQTGRPEFCHFLILVGLLRLVVDLGAYDANLRQAFRSAEIVDHWRELYFFQEADAAHARKEHSACVDWCERGLQELPDSLALTGALGAALLFTRDYARARQIGLAALRHPRMTPALRPQMQGLVATANLDLVRQSNPDEAQLLDEADRLTAEMMRLAPWLNNSRLSRGCLLIERGELAEGVRLLEGLEPSAYTHCYLALAAAKAGQPDRCREHFDQARRRAPDDSNIALMEKRAAPWVVAGA